MDFGLMGKRALVVGVSGNLGGAIARSLLVEGAPVIDASRKPPADQAGEGCEFRVAGRAAPL